MCMCQELVFMDLRHRAHKNGPTHICEYICIHVYIHNQLNNSEITKQKKRLGGGEEGVVGKYSVS